MIDLKPFTKIAWHSPKIKRRYEPIFREASSLSSKVEYEMVRRGYRDADVYHMEPQNFDNAIEKITKDGLVFLPILRSKKYSGFSHKHFCTDKIDMNTFVFGVVARDLETAEKFKEASKSGDHITQGLLLGYPKCCCQFFNHVWTEEKALDPCYEIALNTEGCDTDKNPVEVEGHPFLNQMLRYFGIRITPFFPCSFKCEEAVKVGETWFSLMKSLNDEVADEILELLKLPLTWSLHKAIIYIKTPLFRGVVNGYWCDRKKEFSWNCT
ncbi:MAG: hypothetical protein ACXQTR_06545 [Candidatus Methanospirareceae archaeon]